MENLLYLCRWAPGPLEIDVNTAVGSAATFFDLPEHQLHHDVTHGETFCLWQERFAEPVQHQTVAILLGE